MTENVLFTCENPEFMPTKPNRSDACWDLYAAANFEVQSGNSMKVHTGVRFMMPKNMAGFIWPRSGLSTTHNMDVLGGVIDADYTGEIIVGLMNHGETYYGTAGSRIAQIYFAEKPEVQMLSLSPLAFEEKILERNPERGESGFGSSGA